MTAPWTRRQRSKFEFAEDREFVAAFFHDRFDVVMADVGANMFRERNRRILHRTKDATQVGTAFAAPSVPAPSTTSAVSSTTRTPTTRSKLP